MTTKNELFAKGCTLFLEKLNDSKKDLKFNSDFDIDDILSELSSLEVDHLDDVVYNHEAWEICAGECSGYQVDEEFDFSGCSTAAECLLIEANAISHTLQREGIQDCIDEISHYILHVIETAAELGFDGEMRITTGGLFGWVPHNRETEEGCCIYDEDKTGYYPRKIEGELYAVEHEIAGGVYMSACWNPEDTDEGL